MNILKKIIFYLIVILILLYNCSPFFIVAGKLMWIILLSVLIISAFLFKRRMFNFKLFLVLIFSWILIIMQGMLFQGISPAAIYQPIIIFYLPFLVISLYGISFFKYLFNVIYFVAIYTSIIYLLQVFVPSFDTYISQAFINMFEHSWSDWPRSILIYSIPRESGYFFPRNSGIFHEPGAYANYLVLAIIINTIQTKKAFCKRNIFLSIVLLSTFSTTGYIMLFLILTYSIWSLRLSMIFKFLFLFLFLSYSLVIYEENKFLQNKIQDQYTSQNEAIESGQIQYNGRFYFFLQSVKTFSSSPIIGQGILYATAKGNERVGIVGLGFIGLIARYGIIFGIFYLWYFFKGFKNYAQIFNADKLYILLAFVVINIGLLSQSFFFDISFVVFFIFGLINIPKRIGFKRINNHKVVHEQSNHIFKSSIR